MKRLIQLLNTHVRLYMRVKTANCTVIAISEKIFDLGIISSGAIVCEEFS